MSWAKKCLMRRRLCLFVEEWQKRIVTRLREDQWEGFRTVRGRVSASFAQNKILGGDTNSAKKIVSHYGLEMPHSWSAQLMKAGLRTGMLGWIIACILVSSRELGNSWMLSRFPQFSTTIMSIARSIKGLYLYCV